MKKEEFITERTRIISEMLDNPENGIYPTSRCFVELDLLYDKIVPKEQQGEEEIYYECTKCKWRMTKVEYFSVKEDFGCPKCQTTFHKFTRINKGEPVSAEGISDLRSIMLMINEQIEHPKNCFVMDLKALWNDISNAVTKIETSQQGAYDDSKIK